MLENKVSKKYVLLLFSILVLLVVGNLIVDFNLLDFSYLCFMIIMGLRYVKIKYTAQNFDLGQYIFYLYLVLNFVQIKNYMKYNKL